MEEKKILVIDDDPTSNTLVSFLLKSNDYDVSVAKDGDEGLQKADEIKPDLIILDVMMPKKDGFTFLTELKQKNMLNIPPIIMLTSREQMEATFKLEGVAEYFVKPVDTKKLLAKVNEILKPQQ